MLFLECYRYLRFSCVFCQSGVRNTSFHHSHVENACLRLYSAVYVVRGVGTDRFLLVLSAFTVGTLFANVVLAKKCYKSVIHVITTLIYGTAKQPTGQEHLYFHLMCLLTHN